MAPVEALRTASAGRQLVDQPHMGAQRAGGGQREHRQREWVGTYSSTISGSFPARLRPPFGPPPSSPQPPCLTFSGGRLGEPPSGDPMSDPIDSGLPGPSCDVRRKQASYAG